MKTPAIWGVACALALAAAGEVSGQALFAEPLSPRLANYDIEARLDVESKTLDAKLLLHWTNSSDDELTELWMHTYLNAFRDGHSTFLANASAPYADVPEGEAPWGAIDIEYVKYAKGEYITGLAHISPDDGNLHDRTVLRVSLPDTLHPGQSIDLEVKFRSKLPRLLARTGYSRDFFLVAQWFPKIGVYEDVPGQQGRWNCHQFHPRTEFFADFGVYNVGITLPNRFKLGATGELQSQMPNPDSTTTWVFRAEDVSDFAWAASPRFVVRERQWEHVNLQLLVQPEHLHLAERYLEAAAQTLDHLDRNLGLFPYEKLTLIDPPFHGMAAGGMEYPTLVTLLGLDYLPEAFRQPEVVAVHEVAHQYFQGMLASDEVEEAWLDEGFTTYFELRVLADWLGEKNNLLDDWMGLRLGVLDMRRSALVAAQDAGIPPMASPSWQVPERYAGTLAYSKPALMLLTLERHLGRELMDKILRAYFEAWSFGHPRGRDFEALATRMAREEGNTALGADLTAFFDQCIRGNSVCDYAVQSIDNLDGESVLRLSRLGDMVLPSRVMVEFEDGQRVEEVWDGKSLEKQFRYQGKGRIVWAEVDPYQQNLLDIDMNNNSRSEDPASAPFWKYFLKFLFWLENAMLGTSLFA